MSVLQKSDSEIIALIQKADVAGLEEITKEFAEAIKSSLHSLVVNGGTFKDAVTELQNVGGQLTQYSEVYINTTRAELSQKITDISADHYEEDGGTPYFEYFGALPDEVTRKICLIGLGVNSDSRFPNAPFFTASEKSLFETTFGRRWNCRHEFNLISEEYYRNMTGADIDLSMNKKEIDDIVNVGRAQAIKAEPKVTEFLFKQSTASKARLVGLMHRIKDAKSFARKVTEQSVKFKMSRNLILREKVNDILRYTMEYSEAGYSRGVEKVLTGLQKAGYEIRVTKNFWNGSQYRGLHLKLVKDGQRIELQFHTRASFKLKAGESHALYKKLRELPKTALIKRAEIENRLTEIWSEIPVPSGALSF